MRFTRLLIANRGEIAVRVARTCRELGIETVAVFSTADRNSAVVRMADHAVHIGPAAARRSYQLVPAMIEAARTTGADAVHPGYGFLSEDPDFAEVCHANGLVFVGPRPEVMKVLGDKAMTRAAMRDAGLPLLPGTVEPVSTAAEAMDAAADVGFPVIIKAVAGGGGRGLSIVRHRHELPVAFQQTRATAAAVFGDGRVYLERYLPLARHVEVQVLCDQHGNGVYLGDRDCSTQRRHQKLVEEAPAPGLAAHTRVAMGEASVAGALAVGFTGAGTMEFLLDGDGSYYLMEMNARLQVEHPVTEMVTGIDLVEQQLLVAQGEPLRFRQSDIALRGSSIECRINAEDAQRDFLPTPGTIERLQLPAGPFTRVDTHVFAGYHIPPDYDSLLAKVVVWAPDRPRATARMARALTELVIEGPRVCTTTGFVATIIDHPLFRTARHTTDLIERIQNPLHPDFTKKESIMIDKSARLNPTELRDLLVTEVGIDRARLTELPNDNLSELGLDSMAQVELGVVLRLQHGIAHIPDDTNAMSFHQLADLLCSANV